MRIDTAAIFARVKQNHATLAACSLPHDFLPDSQQTFCTYTCSKCKGTASGPSVHWYKLGLADAKRV